ncbi:MAG: sensor histidine kinase, partial [Planctomycetales bacterium]|nr:sensor histidine kinase [Planctomycetales bacterium]
PNTVFPVDDICTEVIDAFNLAAESQEIDLTYKCLDAELSVCGDYEELLTVLNNLVSNAIRYTPQGGRVCLQSYADADQAVIEVSDTGLGIAPEHQTRIFERFYRVDRARSRELGGTGLGLSIVKHLTQSMGGQVEVESQIGVGSTFRIKLPRKNA